MTFHAPERFRVLCIEDEPEILRDVADELADHGFRVDQASSAEAALPVIEREPPDLIVCDVQMPGMSGLELLEHLRARGDAISLVPFVFLTAFSDRDSIINGRRAGADDYLVKPVDYDLLIAAVEGHLHNAALRQAAARAAPGSDGNADDEREALLARLAASPAGEGVAVVKIDTQPELARRLGGKNAEYLAKLVRRLARKRGLDAFRLHSHAWALAGDESSLMNTLAPIVDLQFRDRGALGIAKARITMSVVISRTSERETPEGLIDRLTESARLLQREGGGRMLELDGPEMSEIRLATSIRAELVTAIRQGQLHVCFQPKVDAESGAPVSAEVLVRWESPLLGHLSPATFIPVVERAGLLGHVTDWVLRQAAASQVALRNAGLPARLAVNIGASEFNDALPSRIARIFAEHGADESLLEVEVTETSVLTDPAEADLIVQALHERGIAVALDDFGTGYSSLAHLQTCAVDTIKIDRSFVKRVAESGPDQKIVLGIISLARMLGMETVAEGVELESQRTWLTEHDCDTLQGYVISRPLRFEDYCALLESWLGKTGAGMASSGRTSSGLHGQ